MNYSDTENDDRWREEIEKLDRKERNRKIYERTLVVIIYTICTSGLLYMFLSAPAPSHNIAAAIVASIVIGVLLTLLVCLILKILP